MMQGIGERVRGARAELEAIIDRVCGACANSCCHQGTMMGSADLRRLYKGLRIEPERERIVREGLRRRAEELQTDLGVLTRVAELIAASYGEQRAEELATLQARIADWQHFTDELGAELDLSPAGLAQLLQFSALRSNCIRALRQFEGAQAMLANLSRDTASFRLSGRRVSAPRCLFHFGGCLAGRWKPAKCANFFCAGEPNVLREVAAQMGFDDFVLASFVTAPGEEVLRAVTLELELGREYVEPKIIVGLDAQGRDRLIAAVEGALDAVTVQERSSSFMWSTKEARSRLGAMAADEALVLIHSSAGGAALYELAVAIDGLRATGLAPALYLLLEDISLPSPLAHPLWADSMMTQPLGSLDLYIVE